MKRLPFRVEPQLRSQLCWAAVGCSISRFYGMPTPQSQDALAAEIFGTPNNCLYLPAATLAHLGLLAGQLARPLQLSEIALEIDSGRLIVVRLQWAFGGGHPVVLSGYSHRRRVWIEDPMNGNGALAYKEFRDRLLGWGRWTHTYFIKDPTHNVPAITRRYLGAIPRGYPMRQNRSARWRDRTQLTGIAAAKSKKLSFYSEHGERRFQRPARAARRAHERRR